MTHDERVLNLEGVHNFRDYGGYSAAGGGRVRRGVLWRSGQHRKATGADLERIGTLALETVVDLRGSSERQASPCPRPAGFGAEVILYDGETAGLAPHIEAAADVLDADDARAAMQAMYREIAFRSSLTTLIRQLFAVLGSRSGASLVHCHAGKDRTGIAVAMVHHALGVHRDDIMTDYMMTLTAGNNAARIASMMTGMREGPYAKLTDEASRVLAGVDESFLEAAIAAAEERHGSLDGYLAEVLDVDAAARERLRERLIEG